MVTTLVGKLHRKGTAKESGKPYDFSEIHYLGRRKGVEGLAAITKTVGVDIISYDEIEINAAYEIERDDSAENLTMKKADLKTSAPASAQSKA